MIEQLNWLAPISIVLFGGLFWQVNHWLHVLVGVEAKESEAEATPDTPGEKPRDRMMGLVSGLALIPVFAVAILPVGDIVSVFAYAAYPVLVMVLLGRWRGRQSVSAVLFYGAHALEMALLASLNDFSEVRSCGESAARLNGELRISAISLCAETARFWVSNWITLSLAFAALFGATLAVLYTVKPADYGWPGVAKERQVLAMLYSLCASWMLVAGFLWWGLPAIRLVRDLTRIGSS